MAAEPPIRPRAPGLGAPAPAGAPAEIEHLFQVSLLLLIVTGFGTLASTGKLDFLSLLCVTGVLLVRAVLLLRDAHLAIPRRLASWLAVLYPLIFLFDFFFFSGRDFVTPTVHLVLFGLCVKLFNVERDRDYVYLAVLAFLMVLSAAVLTVDSAFLAAFALFLVLAVFWFMAMELRRSALTAPNAAALVIPGLRKRRRAVSPLHRLAGSLTRTTVVMVAAIAATGTVLFFAMPRIGGGYVSRRIPSDVLSVGYSDNVELGIIGRIQQSSEVVAHVHIEDDTTGDREIRLRGAVLTQFNGRRWTNPPRESDLLSQSYGRVFQLTAHAPQLQRREELRLARGPQLVRLKYRVLLEPLNTNVIFTVPTAQALEGPFRQIGVDKDLTFHNLDPDHSVTLYEGISDASVPVPTALARLGTEKSKDPLLPKEGRRGPPRSNQSAEPASYPPDFAERYLQLPDRLDPRIPELAREITATEPTPYLRALAIEHYLSGRYTYTLQLPSRLPEDPVADFLFSRRRGHCEYFASSMALLLRSVGIPSRIVNGFRGGQFNQLNASYIVRARDAHSWVEGFIPGAGWVTFDPTPGGERAAAASLWSRWQLYLDASQEFWREWIVNYDTGHQQALSVAAARQGRNRAAELRLWFERRYRAMLEEARRFHRATTHSPQHLLRRMRAWLGLLFVIGIGMGALLAYERWRAASPRLSPRSAASILYLRMNGRLARRGYARPPGQTPSEFAAGIPEPELRGAVVRFTAAYERARFGDCHGEAAQLPNLLAEVRKTLSRSS
jgi:protein-glutamine gamma-glutamyltransferase